jgi:hypothetical protein
VLRQNWLDAYNYVTDKGALALNDYARASDPFSKVVKVQVSVEISSVIHASDDSFRVSWTERRYVDEALAATERWSAILTIVLETPTDADRLKKNSLGVYIHALELRSAEKTYMASVSWAYASDQLIALRRQNTLAEAAAPVASGVDLEALNFRYSIEGDNAAWRPLRAFDDGRQVFIEFPRGISRGEMPPLWVIGAEGGAELVNYRVQGNHMIVDRLFAAAEFRLGGEHQKKVRIVRTDGRPQS